MYIKFIDKIQRIILILCSILIIFAILLNSFAIVCYFANRDEIIFDLMQKVNLVKNDFSKIYKLNNCKVNIGYDIINVEIQDDYSILESYKLKYDKNYNLVNERLDSFDLIISILFYLMLMIIMGYLLKKIYHLIYKKYHYY